MLGKKIRKARNLLGLSQQEVALKIDKTTRSYISALELSLELPAKQTLLALCNVLELNFDEMLKLLKIAKRKKYKLALDGKLEPKRKRMGKITKRKITHD